MCISLCYALLTKLNNAFCQYYCKAKFKQMPFKNGIFSPLSKYVASGIKVFRLQQVLYFLDIWYIYIPFLLPGHWA